MKRTTTIIFICALLAASVFAQSNQQKPATGQPAAKPADTKPADAMPTADQILDKYIQALGGKAAIEKVKTRVSKGSFEIPAMGAGGPIETYAKAPNKSLAVIDITGFGVVQRGFDGTVGWSQDPQSGLRELSGAELISMKRGSDLYADLKYKEMYSKLTVKEKTKVGDKDAYLVEAIPTEGSPQKLYFDAQTGLALRRDSEEETAQGKVLLEVYMEDYRDVDGIKIPFTIKQNTPALSFVIKLDDVKHNVPVDDAKFNKPATQ